VKKFYCVASAVPTFDDDTTRIEGPWDSLEDAIDAWVGYSNYDDAGNCAKFYWEDDQDQDQDRVEHWIPSDEIPRMMDKMYGPGVHRA
jgi:hypothetical protein